MLFCEYRSSCKDLARKSPQESGRSRSGNKSAGACSVLGCVASCSSPPASRVPADASRRGGGASPCAANVAARCRARDTAVSRSCWARHIYTFNHKKVRVQLWFIFISWLNERDTPARHKRQIDSAPDVPNRNHAPPLLRWRRQMIEIALKDNR